MMRNTTFSDVDAMRGLTFWWYDDNIFIFQYAENYILIWFSLFEKKPSPMGRHVDAYLELGLKQKTDSLVLPSFLYVQLSLYQYYNPGNCICICILFFKTFYIPSGVCI